jgi:hypothetical protein
MKAREFAIIIGKLLTNIPYINHARTPAEVRANIPVEMSLVDFVFQTLSNCGNRAPVVNAAAIKPIIITLSIGFLGFTVF